MFCTIRFMTPLIRYISLLAVAFLSGCYVGPDAPILSYLSDSETHIYKLYPGSELPESEIVKIDLTDAYYTVIDGFNVGRSDYQQVYILPGKHEILWGKWFAFSVMVEPSMWGKGEGSAVVDLKAGHTYELYADRTYGHGYKLYFWIQDADSQEVIAGSKKP